MHFCGADQLHGFEERLTTDIYPADFGWTPDWTRFEHRPSWYHSMDSVTQAGPCTRTNQIDFDDEVVFQARQKLFDMARSKDRRPFCMVASMTHPHDPYAIPQAYWDRYSGVDIDMPRVRMAPEHLDPHSRRLRHVCGLDGQPVNEEQVRAARRAYYGAVSYVDDQVGTLLGRPRRGRLRRRHRRDAARRSRRHARRARAVVQNEFLRAGLPDTVDRARTPALPARRVAHSASLVDIAPTLCELAGAESADYATPLDGNSLTAQLAGAAGRDEVIGEYLAEGAIAPLVMIKRGRYKFVHSPVDPDQLYDLIDDPDETQNLAPAAAHAARVREFRAETMRRWDLPALHAAVIESQRRRHLVYEALRAGRYTPWDFQPVRDASRLYVRNDQQLGGSGGHGAISAV